MERHPARHHACIRHRVRLQRVQGASAPQDGQEPGLIKISTQQRTLRYRLVKASRPAEDAMSNGREIVSKILGVPVERFDDGTANSIVDAEVHYPGRKAALEVVTDHDPAL